jgi:hypothetical protein
MTTSFQTPASPASMTAFVLDLVGKVPPLDPQVRETFTRDEDATRVARALATESFISSITVSNADDPQLEVPTVLLFSEQSWEVARSSVGAVPAGQRDRGSATWHDAFPTADGRYLLVPNVHRPNAVSFYRVTRDEDRSAYAYHVGAVSRRALDDEIWWEEDDDRCHLIRYASGALECLELDCEQSCGGGADVDNSGIEHLPCGCPQ